MRCRRSGRRCASTARSVRPDGLVACGDHRETASIQGALVSGHRAARTALELLGQVAV